MALLDPIARRLLDRVRLAVGRTATRQGAHRSKTRGTGLEFTDHRPYVPGDEVRHIDWKAFARHGQLHVRQFEEERDARVEVLLDVSGSMSRGAPRSKLARAQPIAAALAYVGQRQFDRVQVRTFGDALGAGVPPVRHAADLPGLEGLLLRAQASGPTDFPAVVRALAAQSGRPCAVVVVGDLMKPDGFPQGFRALGALGHTLTMVHVHCAEDLAPALDGEVELIDAEDARTVRLRASSALLRAYRREVEAHLEGCRDAVRGVGGRFVDVPVELPFEAALKRVFDVDGTPAR